MTKKKLSFEEVQMNIDNKYVDDKYTLINYTTIRESLTIKHDKCGTIFTKQYSSIIRSLKSIACEDCLQKHEDGNRLREIQENIDSKYGKGIYIVLNESAPAVKDKLLLKHTKCNTVFNKKCNWVLGSTAKSGICDNCREIIYKEHNDVAKDTYERTNGKISYVRDFKNTKKPCIFKFVKCGHEFTDIPSRIQKYYKETYCKDCKDRKLVNDNSFYDKIPFHDLVDKYKSPKTSAYYFTLKCKYCGSEKSVDKNCLRSSSCNCASIIKTNITRNINDIILFGKTELLCDYLKENNKFLDTMRKSRTVEYNIEPSALDALDYENLEITRKELYNLELPYSKILLKMNLEYNHINIDCCIKEFLITKIEDYTIDNTFVMNINIGKNDYTIEGYINNGRITFINEDTNINVRMKKGFSHCLKLVHLLTRKLKTNQEIYESDRLLNGLNNNIVGEYDIVEVKTLILDTIKNRMKIVNKGHTRRIVKCNFLVAGHYRHYDKTNKTIFIESFEKGLAFKDLRRIEKNYILK